MIFYRFEDRYYESNSVYVQEIHWHLLRETPRGYWIIDSYAHRYRDNDWTDVEKHKKWVSKDSRKRFAYPDRKQAWEAFKARKTRQLQILRHQVQNLEQLQVHLPKFQEDHIDTPPPQAREGEFSPGGKFICF